MVFVCSRSRIVDHVPGRVPDGDALDRRGIDEVQIAQADYSVPQLGALRADEMDGATDDSTARGERIGRHERETTETQRGYSFHYISYFPRSIMAASSVARFPTWLAQRLLSISRAAFSQSPALIEAMVLLNRRKPGSPRLNTISRTTSLRTGSRPGNHGNARVTSRRTVAMSLSRSINASARVIPASSRFRPTPIVSLRLASR